MNITINLKVVRTISYFTTFNPNSSNCSPAMGEGESIITSRPELFLGKINFPIGNI
ncbi:MAG: hypothetical protein L3J66_01725 [Bacteroidales bacterium]|nr:hypothetical protein [Bacteroidales bacterium]